MNQRWFFWNEFFSQKFAYSASVKIRGRHSLCAGYRVWVFPTSILQSKISRCIYVCIACGCYETSQRSSKIWKSFCNQDRPFSSSTWSGRLFFCSEVFAFAIAASRASWYQLTIFESDFTNPTSKTLVGLRPNPIFSTKLHRLRILADAEQANFLRKNLF